LVPKLKPDVGSVSGFMPNIAPTSQIHVLASSSAKYLLAIYENKTPQQLCSCVIHFAFHYQISMLHATAKRLRDKGKTCLARNHDSDRGF